MRTAGEEIIKQPQLSMKQLIRFANTTSLVQLKLYVNLYTYIYIFLYIYVFGVHLYLSVRENKVGDGVKFHNCY